MPKLTISDLDRELRGKNLRPIYFIYGEEDYLARTALSRIKDCVSKMAGGLTEPDRFSGRDSGASDIISCAETIPMLGGRRLVIVTEADSIKGAEAFERYFKRPSPTTAIIFLAEKADGRTKFVQLLSSAGAVIECKPLYNDKIPDWIRMEASSRGRSISMEAAGIMAELVGSNLGEIESALGKVILYIGQKKIIEEGDVETVLTGTARKSIFELTDAVGRRNLIRALDLLGRLAEFHESEVMILSMLARHWRILIKAKEAVSSPGHDRYSLPKFLGVNPFFVNDYLEQARLFTPKELKSGFRKLYLTDKLLKSSKVPKTAILERCVRELITADSRPG